jgi:uroporphyrinogen decarboxylase
MNISRKETVKRAVHFQNPAYIPLRYTASDDKADVIIVPVEHHFMGPDNNNSEWGFTWYRVNEELSMGTPIEALIKTWDDLKNIKIPDANDPERFKEMREAIEKYGNDRYYIADLVLTGFTIVTFLREFDKVMEDLCLERENIEKLLDIVFDFENSLIPLIAAQGFDCINFADDWGTQQDTIISRDMFIEIFKPRYTKQFKLIHDYGMDVYFHCCGMVYPFIQDFIDMGIDILNLGQPTINGIEKVGKEFAGKVCFAFPVSYQSTGVHGTREQIFQEVQDIVKYCNTPKGGLIGLVLERMTLLGGSPNQSINIREAFETYCGPNNLLNSTNN